MPPKNYTVKVAFSETGYDQIMQTLNKSGRRLSARARDRAKDNIKKAGRVDTGRMRNSMNYVLKQQTRTTISYEIGARVPYGIFQEEGVKGPIYPRRTKFLRFKPKGAKGFVFAKKVKGFKGAHFLADALKSLKITDAT